MKVMELFCGTKSFSNIAKARGHETFTIDIDKQFNPDLCIDILDFKMEMLPEEWRHPDVIWASPPCTTFSVASISRYWDNGKPKNEKTLHGIAIVKKTIEIIRDLNPKYWIIENPRGMLRKQDFMQDLPRKTVTYCKYGLEYQKCTDLWNNIPQWIPREMCKPNSPCHVRSPRGSRNGIQGVGKERRREGMVHPDWNYRVSRNAINRAIVPTELCSEILSAIEAEK